MAETKRRRATGTRDRIMSRLARSGAIYDENGMASAVLANEVGYPGSSVAFAQLLSGMERSGLIEREVRGKRTYRISAAADSSGAAAAAASAPAAPAAPDAIPGAGPVLAGPDAAQDPADPDASGDFDYDELARRLLVEVVRRLAATPAQASPPPRPAPSPSVGATLEQTVAGLEQELASARTMHGTLTEENARLRRQLQAARRSLALARRSAGQPVTDQLDDAEVSLLERLLTHAADTTRNEETG